VCHVNQLTVGGREALGRAGALSPRDSLESRQLSNTAPNVGCFPWRGSRAVDTLDGRSRIWRQGHERAWSAEVHT
jgi:hypothetical protein